MKQKKEQKADSGSVSQHGSNALLAAVFQDGVVETVRKHIDKKGMPPCKEKCPLREAFFVSNRHGTSKRATYCCKVRTGLFLSDWRCVGLNDNRCVMKVANDCR